MLCVCLEGEFVFSLFSDPGVSRAEEGRKMQLCASSDKDDIFRTWQGEEGKLLVEDLSGLLPWARSIRRQGHILYFLPDTIGTKNLPIHSVNPYFGVRALLGQGKHKWG